MLSKANQVVTFYKKEDHRDREVTWFNNYPQAFGFSIPGVNCFQLFMPCRSCFEVLSTWFPFFLPTPIQNSQSLEKCSCSQNPEAKETCRRSKKLSSDLFALCPLQDPRAADLHSCRTHCWPPAPSWAGRFPPWSVNCGSSCFANAKHPGLFWGKKEGRWHVCDSGKCLSHCLAPWPHLQAAKTSSG